MVHPCTTPYGRTSCVQICSRQICGCGPSMALALTSFGSVDSVYPAPHPTGTLASLLCANRLSCRFVTPWPPFQISQLGRIRAACIGRKSSRVPIWCRCSQLKPPRRRFLQRRDNVAKVIRRRIMRRLDLAILLAFFVYPAFSGPITGHQIPTRM